MLAVVEIGGYAAGYCGRLFAQTGNFVTRIDMGQTLPAWTSKEAMDVFLHSDKSMLETQDRNEVNRLVNSADIVVLETSTADEIEQVGFDGWSCPVKVVISPFGRTGPYKNWQATSSTLLAMGGFTNLMGDPDRAPLTLPGHFVEFQSGGFAYAASLACALADETNSIDIGMLEVVMALSQFTTVMWHCASIVRSRHGNDFWSVVPTNLFRCRDGWVYINIVPGFWDPFVAFLELPELVLDERFVTNTRRMQNRQELHEITAGVLAKLTRNEVQQRAVDCRIPLGAVLSFEEVLDDVHLAARNMWISRSTPSGHAVNVPRLPWLCHDKFPTDQLAHS
ncbi:MAG: hypothetical protein F4X44_03620 [Gammaproteobacteria bacterium]|nr:hypothetical protein [Gammaproteobacteria bacterium]MYD79683.1 hypothetical protein [Gammaproteobacteria bacterium]